MFGNGGFLFRLGRWCCFCYLSLLIAVAPLHRLPKYKYHGDLLQLYQVHLTSSVPNFRSARRLSGSPILRPPATRISCHVSPFHPFISSLDGGHTADISKHHDFLQAFFLKEASYAIFAVLPASCFLLEAS